MSIIQKFFTLPPFLLRRIIKPANVINQVSPNLYEDLRDSSKQFIKAILNKDSDFIRQVTSKSLGDRIIQDMQEYQNVDFVEKFNLKKYHFDSSEIFEISPYVVFGDDFKDRIQRPNLWENTKLLSANRFIKIEPNLSKMEIFRSYGQKQIFGFNCLYDPLMVDVADSEKIKHIKSFMITFQTDSVNIDPYIVDCQGAIFEDWKANGFM